MLLHKCMLLLLNSEFSLCCFFTEQAFNLISHSLFVRSLYLKSYPSFKTYFKFQLIHESFPYHLRSNFLFNSIPITRLYMNYVPVDICILTHQDIHTRDTTVKKDTVIEQRYQTSIQMIANQKKNKDLFLRKVHRNSGRILKYTIEENFICDDK